MTKLTVPALSDDGVGGAYKSRLISTHEAQVDLSRPILVESHAYCHLGAWRRLASLIASYQHL